MSAAAPATQRSRVGWPRVRGQVPVLSAVAPGRVSCSPSVGQGCAGRKEPVRAPTWQRGSVAEPGHTRLPPTSPGVSGQQRSGSSTALGPADTPCASSPRCSGIFYLLPAWHPANFRHSALNRGSIFVCTELLFENCHRHRQVRLRAAHARRDNARRTVSLRRIIALISALHTRDSLADIRASPM